MTGSNSSAAAWATTDESTYPGEAWNGRIRAILVDDDDDFRESLGWSLEDLGFEVLCLADGKSLLDALEDATEADVVVLDWRLKFESGIEVLSALRQRGHRVPVLFLTGYASREFEQRALDQGALDFVDKARGAAVVGQRIRMIAQASRHDAPEAAPAVAHHPEDLVSGRVTFRPKTCRATLGDVDIGLTVTEFNIVHLLAVQAGACVSYRAIYDCVHGAGFAAGYGEDGFRTNVRSAIRRIRGKFAALSPDADFIENIPALGYCWRSGYSADAAQADAMQSSIQAGVVRPGGIVPTRLSDWLAARVAPTV